MNQPTHLTPEQLAARLQVPERTLLSWRSRGVGPRYVKVGRAIRYPVKLLIEWEEEQTR